MFLEIYNFLKIKFAFIVNIPFVYIHTCRLQAHTHTYIRTHMDVCHRLLNLVSFQLNSNVAHGFKAIYRFLILQLQIPLCRLFVSFPVLFLFSLLFIKFNDLAAPKEIRLAIRHHGVGVLPTSNFYFVLLTLFFSSSLSILSF